MQFNSLTGFFFFFFFFYKIQHNTVVSDNIVKIEFAFRRNEFGLKREFGLPRVIVEIDGLTATLATSTSTLSKDGAIALIKAEARAPPGRPFAVFLTLSNMRCVVRQLFQGCSSGSYDDGGFFLSLFFVYNI